MKPSNWFVVNWHFEFDHMTIVPLFSDLCFCTYVFDNSYKRFGTLELPPKEYSWRNWLPYCKFTEANRKFTNSVSFLYYGHNTIHFFVPWQSFAKIQPNCKCKCNYSIRCIRQRPSKFLMPVHIGACYQFPFRWNYIQLYQ